MQIKRRNNPVEINDKSLVESLYRARGLESEDFSIELSFLFLIKFFKCILLKLKIYSVFFKFSIFHNRFSLLQLVSSS
jgi:hypothetical protein